MWKNEDGGGFRVWDVTKNDTLQHNQTALMKLRCAKQYANHCNFDGIPNWVLFLMVPKWVLNNA